MPKYSAPFCPALRYRYCVRSVWYHETDENCCLFHLNERVFHVWQYQVNRFRPRYLCRYSPHLLPCCGGPRIAHTDGAHGKPRTRIDKTKTHRSVLLSAHPIRCCYPVPSRSRPVPSYRRGGTFFSSHRLISPAVSLSHPLCLISSRSTCRVKRGDGRLVSFPIPGFVPYRLVSSDEGKQDDGAVVPSCRPIPWRSFISPQSRLRLVRRLGLSCRRASRLASFRPGSSHQMRDKQARRQGVSSSSVPSHPPRPRHPCGRACRPRVLVPLSPHPQQASRRAGRTRQPRGVGGGLFFQAVGSDGAL